jgi:hypothetical protein
MPLPKPTWRVYAGAGLLIWAAGLQVIYLLTVEFAAVYNILHTQVDDSHT